MDPTPSHRNSADLYQRRWAEQPRVPRASARGMAAAGIELFFRRIKQTLAIRKFIGTSENAVRSQAFVALTVFLLLRLAHPSQQAVARPLDFIRLVRVHLMHRRDLRTLNGETSRAGRQSGPADLAACGATHRTG